MLKGRIIIARSKRRSGRLTSAARRESFRGDASKGVVRVA
jgi:hypothetical protein